MTLRGWFVLLTFVCGLVANEASAQSLGTFRWQLQPYCNIVSVTVVQQGAQYQIHGTDDQCGAPRSAAVGGLAFVNPDGSIGFGLHIVTTPGGVPVDIDATIALLTLSGTWRDSAGASGAFTFTPGAGTGGTARPAISTSAGDVTGVAAGSGLTGGGVAGDLSLAVDFGVTQRRVVTSCPAGQLMVAVNQDGTVSCEAVTGGAGGDITGVAAGAGLTGGGVTGDVALAVNFGGTGAATAAARSDHRHEVGASGTAIGASALVAQTAGVNNTAVGFEALLGTTTGSGSVAIGGNALRSTSSSFQVAVGWNALQFSTTGTANTAVGTYALRLNTTGSNNAASGYLALSSNTTGSDNTASGYHALWENTTGARNTAVGSEAMANERTGVANTAIGNDALRGHSTGNSNTAIGDSALASLVSGDSNVALGYGALSLNAAGTRNTALGTAALNANTGSRNIAVGNDAGVALTTGDDNVYLANPGLPAESGTIRLGSGGTHTRLFVAGTRGVTTGMNDAVPVVIDGGGQLSTVSSSRRTKNDIEPLGAVSRTIFDLRPVSFTYKQPFADGSTPIQYGLIAEEVEQVLPALVVYGADGQPETVKYHVLPTLLLAEIQRLERERAKQSEELAALWIMVETLQRKLLDVVRK